MKDDRHKFRAKKNKEMGFEDIVVRCTLINNGRHHRSPRSSVKLHLLPPIRKIPMSEQNSSVDDGMIVLYPPIT